MPATLTNLQRKQPFNNIHRLQADRNHFPNQLDDVLRVVCQAEPFSFKNFQMMSLTASLGRVANNRRVSAILVYPAKRKTDRAVLRKAAMT